MKPNFIVIGAARSGTTSLFQYLDPHPEVFMSQVKELNFFSNEKYWKKGLDWYESRFKAPKSDVIKAVGEASTSYTKAPFTANVVNRIYIYNPEIRLIYFVRNPVDRYLSHYMQRVQAGIETRKFRETLKDLNKETCAWQGLYHYQLKRYLEYFPKEQIMVKSMEDLKDKPQTVIEDIYRFIGVNVDFQISGLDKIHNANTKVLIKSALGKNIFYFYRKHLEQLNIPFTVKKLVMRLGDVGGKEIGKPILTSTQREQLENFYHEDSKMLKREFGINTDHWFK